MSSTRRGRNNRLHSFYLTPSQDLRLKLEAKRESRPLVSVVRLALEKYLPPLSPEEAETLLPEKEEEEV